MWLSLRNTLQQLPVLCRVKSEFLTQQRKMCKPTGHSPRLLNLDCHYCHSSKVLSAPSWKNSCIEYFFTWIAPICTAQMTKDLMLLLFLHSLWPSFSSFLISSNPPVFCLWCKTLFCHYIANSVTSRFKHGSFRMSSWSLSDSSSYPVLQGDGSYQWDSGCPQHCGRPSAGPCASLSKEKCSICCYLWPHTCFGSQGLHMTCLSPLPSWLDFYILQDRRAVVVSCFFLLSGSWRIVCALWHSVFL